MHRSTQRTTATTVNENVSVTHPITHDSDLPPPYASPNTTPPSSQHLASENTAHPSPPPASQDDLMPFAIPTHFLPITTSILSPPSPDGITTMPDGFGLHPDTMNTIPTNISHQSFATPQTRHLDRDQTPQAPERQARNAVASIIPPPFRHAIERGEGNSIGSVFEAAMQYIEYLETALEEVGRRAWGNPEEEEESEEGEDGEEEDAGHA